jgi:succinate-semialdehyde dehydrogenase/glutarate-semialdehyde dehydrogenase
LIGRFYDAFLDKFVAGVSEGRIGDPSDEKTELGPLATARIRDDLDNQVKRLPPAPKCLPEESESRGTVFLRADSSRSTFRQLLPAADEELFGPVASVFKAKDLNDAIRIANGTTFGLGASAWTRDEPSGISSSLKSSRAFFYQWNGRL